MSIKRLTLKKLLSFNDSTVELGQLNVLIGPNAVGKSNLIEAVSLLQCAPTSIASQILRGGGIRQWLWLGDRAPSPIATLECELVPRRGRQAGPLVYRLQFSEDSQGFVILDERLAKSGSETDPAGSEVYFERSSLNTKFGAGASGLTPEPQTVGLSRVESVLARFKSPVDPTPITEVGNYFEQIRVFREFKTGPASGARYGTSTSAPKESLSDDGSNLALVLNYLSFRGVRDRIREYLRRFCERFEDVKIDVGAGIAQAFLQEAGLLEMLSAVRMSGGTLKFLCLLAALFHPEPPPLMCIEEPELGLHPDALQLVPEALIEASESMQLIVTTHSDALVDSLSDRPESVLVCERDFDNGAQFKRLSKEHLQAWLEQYSLGQLWRRGEIGGGRW